MSDTNIKIMPNIPKSDSADIEIETTETVYKTTHTAVRKARRFLVQGLYEWLMTDRRFEKNGQNDWKANPPHNIAARTRAINAMHTVHLGYYHEMMREIPNQIDELDELIASQLDRDVNRLDMIEHAILLIGAYELKHSLHIPYKVVLDEGMKLNTHFGGTDGHKLINAVLDRLAKVLRIDEVVMNKKSVDKEVSQKKLAVDVVNDINDIKTDNDTKVDNKVKKEEDTQSGKQRIKRNLKPKTEVETKTESKIETETEVEAKIEIKLEAKTKVETEEQSSTPKETAVEIQSETDSSSPETSPKINPTDKQ